MVAVLLGVCDEVTVHVVGWDGVGCGWMGRGQDVGHVIHNTIPYYDRKHVRTGSQNSHQNFSFIFRTVVFCVACLIACEYF